MLPTTRTRRLLGTVALALALVGGAACGADGDDDDASTTTTTEASGGTTTTDDLGSDEIDTDEIDTDEIDTDEIDTDDPDTDEAPSGDRDAYVDALMADLDGEDGELFGPGGVECVASGFVDAIGVDNIRDAGLSPEEFAEGSDSGGGFPDELGVDEDKANDLYDVFGDCDIDLVETLTEVYASFGEVTPEQEACIADTLTDDNLRESFVADFLGEELEDDPLDEVGSCLGFDDLDTAEGPVTSTPAPAPVRPPGS